jgi:hypothetical protein
LYAHAENASTTGTNTENTEESNMAFTFSEDGREKYQMIAMYNAGQTLAQIATHFGCTPQLVDETVGVGEGVFNAANPTGL